MEKKIIQLPVENKKAAKPSEKLKRTVVSHKNWDLSTVSYTHLRAHET